MKIYYVARTGSSELDRVIHGVVERRDWVALKNELALHGLTITYWNWVEEDVLEDLAA